MNTRSPPSPTSNEPANGKKSLLGILDEVIDEYIADKSIIFKDEQERKKYLYGALEDISRTWKRSKRCMVPSCTKHSIPRSHVVPRGMLSDRVGEAGHVLTPGRDRNNNGRLIVQRVGLSEASTFPGFCDVHELIFESFENAKKVSTEQEVVLQAYRTACRELFRTKFWLDKTGSQIEAFKKLRDERLAERVRQRVGAEGLGDAKVNNLLIKDDPLVLAFEGPLEGLRELTVYLESRLVPALEAAVFRSDMSGLTLRAFDVEVELPVGLSGAASIPRPVADKKGLVHFIMGLLPHAANSLTFVVGLAEDQDDLVAYEKRWMQSALEFISMVESWMINGTDQWYLRPSVWNQLGATRQNLILQEIEACAKNVFQEAEQAIFDDVRKHLISKFEAANHMRVDAGYLAYVRKHRDKGGML